VLLSVSPGGEYAVSPRPDELPVPPRQTLFFSATWPKEVQAIARRLCRNDPVQVFVGNVQVGTCATPWETYYCLFCASMGFGWGSVCPTVCQLGGAHSCLCTTVELGPWQPCSPPS
jgi:hypothetical protein